MSDISIRPVTDDELPRFLTAIRDGFGSPGPPEDTSDRFRQALPAERTLAAFDGESIVGTFGGYDLRLTVPGGGQVPMEGTTVVTVFPTHRRMGLLSRMMDLHLSNAADAAYPVAGLWSSDADIYARFGYGIATEYRSIEMRSSQIEFRDEIPVDRVRRVDHDAEAGVLKAVFDRVRLGRPGMTDRSDAWWEHRVLADETWMREGKTARRWVVHEGPGGIDGYAAYRQSPRFDEGYNNGTVSVVEIQTETPRAHASLWSYLTRIDGHPNVEYPYLALDDPLPLMIKEPRRVRTTETRDALWIRILDVKAALEARTYEFDGSIVFGVRDKFRPAGSGTYRLEVTDGVGSVSRVQDDPEVSLDDDVLGALYLGGRSAQAFGSAGRIDGHPRAIERMDRIFRTMRAPWIQEVF